MAPSSSCPLGNLSEGRRTNFHSNTMQRNAHAPTPAPHLIFTIFAIFTIFVPWEKIWNICKYFEVLPMNVRSSSIFNYMECIHVHTYVCKHILHVLAVDSFLPSV